MNAEEKKKSTPEDSTGRENKNTLSGDALLSGVFRTAFEIIAACLQLRHVRGNLYEAKNHKRYVRTQFGFTPEVVFNKGLQNRELYGLIKDLEEVQKQLHLKVSEKDRQLNALSESFKLVQKEFDDKLEGEKNIFHSSVGKWRLRTNELARIIEEQQLKLLKKEKQIEELSRQVEQTQGVNENR